MAYAEKGTPESHRYYLIKLYRWLKQNPHNNPVVEDEANAVAYFYKIATGEEIENA